ncbi:hypothetical protein [Microcoleus sp. CAWBG58]|uniref:hypothetical protein n=1 Tax=Microcoleus sp. CAWBG58 TaxID=2841651 RepID=UPI0025CCEFD8|nr:hypothetical protein [Microcoleus sp. CAWBG58]
MRFLPLSDPDCSMQPIDSILYQNYWVDRAPMQNPPSPNRNVGCWRINLEQLGG